MAISFGLAKKIIDHPSYNLGLALPFVCAFYVMNNPSAYAIPVIGVELGSDISMALDIFGVAIYYGMSVLMFIMAGAVSKMVDQSKGWLLSIIFFLFVSVWSYITQDNIPRVGLLFGALSAVYLLLVFLKMENGALSLALMALTGGALSLMAFVAGILWFENHYVFRDAIGAILGLKDIEPDSLRTGSIMLITSGYVIYYAVFQTGELWE